MPEVHERASDHGHPHGSEGGGHVHTPGSGHVHGPGHAHGAFENLRLAFLINVLFTIIEVVGGVLTQSTAVLADALHDLGDSMALGFALFMERLSQKRRDTRFSYGYRRFSLLSALVSGAVLIGGSVWVFFEAIPRFSKPEVPHADGMILLAVLGIVFNGLGALRLKKSSGFNARMVTWHLMEDVLGWVAILVGALFIRFFHLAWMDPLLAVCFTLFTLWNVVRLGRRTLTILLQGVPSSVDPSGIEESVKAVRGIQSVHDTHIWSMDGDYHVLTTHVVLADSTPDAEIMNIKRSVRGVLTDHAIQHATIEVERSDESCHLREC